MARENMERMGVLDLRDRCYRELSGGQQQRVLLARALCAARKVLLLDEPVSGLDPKATGEMYDLLEGLNREGLALIMISHDIGAALLCEPHPAPGAAGLLRYPGGVSKQRRGTAVRGTGGG